MAPHPAAGSLRRPDGRPAVQPSRSRQTFHVEPSHLITGPHPARLVPRGTSAADRSPAVAAAVERVPRGTLVPTSRRSPPTSDPTAVSDPDRRIGRSHARPVVPRDHALGRVTTHRQKGRVSRNVRSSAGSRRRRHATANADHRPLARSPRSPVRSSRLRSERTGTSRRCRRRPGPGLAGIWLLDVRHLRSSHPRPLHDVRAPPPTRRRSPDHGRGHDRQDRRRHDRDPRGDRASLRCRGRRPCQHASRRPASPVRCRRASCSSSGAGGSGSARPPSRRAPAASRGPPCP